MKLSSIYIMSMLGSIFVAFAAAMIFSSGYAYMDAYHEGWIEVILTGIAFVLSTKNCFSKET